MISCLSSTCRRRQALRAALISLIALCGCQGSLRTWRRDDPGLRDLVVTPHPWDEPTSGQPGRSESPGRDAKPARSRNPKSKAGRSNPYAQTSDDPYANLSDDSEEARTEDELAFEVEDAELKSIISQADPAHRKTLVQLYQAVKAHRQGSSEYPAADDSSYEEETSDHETTDDRYPAQLASSKPMDPRRPVHSNAKNARDRIPQPNNGRTAEPVVLHLGDENVAAEDGGQDLYLEDGQPTVRAASATRPIQNRKVTTDALGNQVSDRKAPEPSGAHFALSDHDSQPMNLQPQELSTRQSTRQPNARTRDTASRGPVGKNSTTLGNRQPLDVQPPRVPLAQRTAVEPMADTGYAEPFAGLGQRDTQAAASNRKQPHQLNHVDNAQAIDAHYTDPGIDQGQVIPASAEAKLDAQPTIRPANRPTPRDGDNTTGDQARHGNSSHNGATVGNASGQPDSIPGESTDQQNWRELAEQTLRALDNETVENNSNAQLNHHVTKRILYVLLGQLSQALEPIPGLQSHEQEYFRHNLQALHNSIDLRGHPVLARRWPLVMENHRTAMTNLRAVSNLEVKNAAFCSNVDGFGVITKFPNYRFRPDQQLLLYCEVDNFVSEQIRNGYETKLRGNYEIIDANQTRVEDVLLPEEVEVCQSQRRDFFFVYRIYTPKQIAPGRYQLRLTIEDVKGNKFGQTTLDLEITAQ